VRERIRLKMLLTTLLLSAWLSGCGTRTVYIRDGEPVRIRKAITNAAIWAKDARGADIPGEMTLPEGWYALPDPGKK
jgi:hypothetical protein